MNDLRSFRACVAWVGLCSLGLVPGVAKADQLDVYVFKSPGLDWSSPVNLSRSVLESYSQIPKHPIGHVAIEYRCGADAIYPERHEYAAMTMGDPLQPLTAMTSEGMGLGLLFYDMEGRLQGENEIEGYKAYHRKHSGMAVLEFLISHESCNRIYEFHQQYMASGDYKHYGLPDRPRYHEGAGCSAFGVGVMEIAGVATTEWESEWSQTILVPDALIGNEGHKISIGDLVTSSPLTDSWATEADPHRSIFFYDPDLMYLWAEGLYASNLQAPKPSVKILPEGKSFGVQLDRSTAPTPTDPIWKTDSPRF